MKIYLIAFGGVAVLGGGLMLNQAADLSANYKVVPAIITDVSYECTIEARRRKIVDKRTDKLSYMDCEIAPMIAKRFNYKESDIDYHATVKYEFMSPVDDEVYEGEFKRKTSPNAYDLDQVIKVHAHNSEAGNSRTAAGNLFVDDTGV